MSVAYVVKKGDCLSSIAKRHGFSDWRRIYNDPENAGFRRKRPNPNLIYPGDVLRIPDGEHPTYQAATGQTHVYQVTLPKTQMRLQLEVQEAHAYEIEIDGELHAGQTDGKSPIELPIRADLTRAPMKLWPASSSKDAATELELTFGDLDPIEELSGVQGRLANLGYFWGSVDGKPSAAFDNAVRQFQIDEKMDPSLGLEQTTRERLRVRHDGE